VAIAPPICLPDAALARRTVLVTRPAKEAEHTASRITALGYDPLIAPLLLIKPRRPRLPRCVQAVLVTSGNALPALTPGGLPLFAVGDATAASARALGFTNVVSAGRDAAALAALAAARLDPEGEPLLLASGAGQGMSLATNLRQRGFRVLCRVCYESVTIKPMPAAITEALDAGCLHAAIFMSAETARCFARILPRRWHASLGGVLALTIGNAAADALKPLAWRGIRRAATPTLDDVLALL
jgi:uroporphyrinogen-III synthase